MSSIMELVVGSGNSRHYPGGYRSIFQEDCDGWNLGSHGVLTLLAPPVGSNKGGSSWLEAPENHTEIQLLSIAQLLRQGLPEKYQ